MKKTILPTDILKEVVDEVDQTYFDIHYSYGALLNILQEGGLPEAMGSKIDRALTYLGKGLGYLEEAVGHGADAVRLAEADEADEADKAAESVK